MSIMMSLLMSTSHRAFEEKFYTKNMTMMTMIMKKTTSHGAFEESFATLTGKRAVVLPCRHLVDDQHHHDHQDHLGEKIIQKR